MAKLPWSFSVIVAMGIVLLWLADSGASAREIVSTAQARWSSLGQDFSTRSNTLTLSVAGQPVVLRTFHAVPGGTQQTVAPALCGNGIADPNAAVVGELLPIDPTRGIYAGERLVVEVSTAQMNRDPDAIEWLKLHLDAPGADAETFLLAETEKDSGVFRSSIATQPPTTGITREDCRMTVAQTQKVDLSFVDIAGRHVPVGAIEVLVDPFGLIVDSQDGRPISGAVVSLVDGTGAPAAVFAPDGVTAWPSTMVSGQAVTDAAGRSYPMEDGEYRFPLVKTGDYRLIVAPPAPYIAPTAMTPQHLAGLRRLGGLPLEINEGSFGRTFQVTGPDPLRVDVPVDRPATAAGLAITASRALAQPGDAIVYTIQAGNPDRVSALRDVVIESSARSGLRLDPDSIRVNGVAVARDALTLLPGGNGFSLRLDMLPPGASRKVTYIMRVRDDAAAGYLENVVTMADSRGLTSRASASVRIEREIIANRMTIIGRVEMGQCGLDGREGIAGVRVMLEDGSFAVTDQDGRYHFEGVVPGTHVVQIIPQSLPEGAVPVDCAPSVRSGGSAISRFVTGQGGGLAVADFTASIASGSVAPPRLALEAVLNWPEQPGDAPSAIAATTPAAPAAAPAAAKPSDADANADDRQRSARKAAGAEVDWMAVGDGPDDFLFPQMGHNPSAPALRVVVRHRPGQTVRLLANDKPVSALSFDGASTSPDGRYAISIWRGVPLIEGTNRITADITAANGEAVSRLEREIHFAGPPVRAELIKERSRLVADGRTRPVVAVRLTDRKGRPVRSGLAGEFTLNAPYESAAALEALQLRQLSGTGAASPRWVVDGEDGVALIELAPTMVSGAVRLGFVFADGDVRREQRIDEWMVPGDQPWTLIALAEGAAGAGHIGGLMKELGPDGSDAGKDGRIAFYAKGKVLGKFLLTAAYDSAKERADQRLLGVIDPNSYYTVFGDGSDRRFDAASREKLYVRIESAGFTALYGDFVTGFDQTDLAAYRRTATGVRAEARDGKWHAEGFAARIASSQRRDEIQGGGISGPYRLTSRAIRPNSERVVIEVRDRFRSELIIERRELARFVDYDIDLLSGTITLRQPLLSRDPDFNPQFMVIDYEVDEGRGDAAINAGIRADYTTTDGALVLGTTVISDSTDDARGTLVAMDVRARLSSATELRGELAASETAGSTGISWQAEAEHHSGRLDVLAYARSIAPDFGISQQNLAEKGRRKIGIDARYALTDALSVTGSSWIDDSLTDASRRHAAQVNALLRTPRNDLRLGVSHFADRLNDGSQQSSSVIEGAVTRRLLQDRLQIELSSSLALGSAGSADLPERYRLGGRYALSSSARLLASYEIAKGAALSARTFNAGIELTPWSGGRISSTLGQSTIEEQGRRTYAAAGLAQSFQVTPALGLDFSVDGNRRLDGQTIVPVNPAQPLANGGQLSAGAGLFEDFTAVTLGANWRKNRWSATGRGEWRDGELADRMGMTLGLIRQLGDGAVLGSGFTWTRATSDGTAASTSTQILDAAIAAAYRPAHSPFAMLAKVEYRADEVTGAVAGETGPAGRSALTITGDGLVRRFIGSLSGNWSPRDASGSSGRSELGIFLGVRHSLDALDGYDLSGTSLVAGLDARQGLGSRIELGMSGTMRANLADGTHQHAFGPSIGLSPVKGTLFTIGYNVRGFEDPDFADIRPSSEGVFLMLRAKLDQDSFAFLRPGGQ